MRKTLLFFGSLLTCVGVTAQVSDQSCVSIAETAASGYSTTLNESQVDALRYYANCEASESSSQSSIDIFYKAFSLGGKYDTNKKNSSCTTDRNALKTSSKEFTSVKTIYRDGLELVNQCLQLAARSWNIKYKLYKDAVSFNIANLSPDGSDLRGIDIISSETLNCKDLPDKYPQKIGASGISVLCSRTPKSQLIGGNTFTEAGDAEINVRLADGPIGIRLPGYASNSLDSVYREFEAVRKEAATFKEALSAATHNPLPQPAGRTPSAVCPAGSYMVGMRFNSDSGGCCGQISNIWPVCKTLIPK